MLKHALIAVLIFSCAALSGDVSAQPRIARYQPDALAPGMTIALEILSFEKNSGAFGRDGIAPNDVRIVLNNPLDSGRVIIGPHVVSWNGRLIQVPIIVPLSAALGTVELRVERGIEKSNNIGLQILDPQARVISFSGSGILGDEVIDTMTVGNTLVVESIELTSSNPLTDFFRFAVSDINGVPQNRQQHPMTILSRGPIRIRNTALSVSADTINGGPGGGGGGAGYVGTGGYGYTGGGSSDTEFVQPATNVGSAALPVGIAFGGSSTTGVRGGKSDDIDQGGGGGTGNPFGSSGSNSGQNAPSSDGGYGGGSAGGENPSGPYGGGGGGFATAGNQGIGIGDNGGKANGGRFLAPMMGGSGGGAGNSFFAGDTLEAGSGGGGGGAVTIISYHSLEISSNARITANGANGESGKRDREGGGGGGSGGGILLAVRDTLRLDNGIFTARNGIGGNGGGSFDSSARGGDGGLGRIRIDALISDTCKTCIGRTVYGPTLSVPRSPVTTPTIKLSGFAGAGNDLTDSVRIYYRTCHTSWKDTIVLRKKTGNVYTWETTISTPPDSLLFVCVYVKVRTPQHAFASHELDWLMGHLSSGVISIKPRAQLVVSPDTLDLGCTKTGTCLDALAYIENRGEAALQIDTVYTVSDDRFTIVTYPKILLGYDPKSITVRYCPVDPPEVDTAQLVIVSGTDTTHKTMLIGCGLDKDRRITLNSPVVFESAHVGDSCDERTLTILSVGDDSVTIDLGNLVRPPFQIIEPVSPIVRLTGKPDTLKVRIRFCPPDSGTFSETFIITERRDSFVVRGVGTRKIFFAPDTVWLGEHCIGAPCLDTNFLVYSVGNEIFTLTGVNADSGTTIIHPLNSQDLPPSANDKVEFRVCFDKAGEFFSELIYVHNAVDSSSTSSTVLHYRVNGFSLEHDRVFDLGAICTGSCDSLTTSIKNRSSRFTITSVMLQDKIFTSAIPQLPFDVAEDSSFAIKLSICPPDSGDFFDTLVVHFQQGECDSTLFIPIHAFSADVALELSAPAVLFDIIDTGSCVRDTISLANPCENDVLVTLPARSGVFSRLEPAVSQVTIAGGGAIDLIYEFCPLDSNLHQAEDTIRFNGSSVLLALSGKGRVPEDIATPFLRFALGHTDNGVVPETFNYTLTVDSIFAGDLITSVTGELHFDPIVVLPREITSDDSGWQLTGTETTPGIFNFTATRMNDITVGPFATIRMQALRSRRDTTPVILRNASMLPQGSVAADTGSIKTNACEVPPPNIIIPGAYKLGDPSPNPLRSQLLVPITIGAEGMLTLKLYTAQGAVVLSKHELIAKGDHQLSVDVSAIAPGFYILEAESWGWRDRKHVIIVQ